MAAAMTSHPQLLIFLAFSAINTYGSLSEPPSRSHFQTTVSLASGEQYPDGDAWSRQSSANDCASVTTLPPSGGATTKAYHSSGSGPANSMTHITVGTVPARVATKRLPARVRTSAKANPRRRRLT